MHPTNKRDRFQKAVLKAQKRRGTHKEFLLRNTTKLCSCSMCGNKRRTFNEKTLQERRFEDTGENND